MMKPISEHKIDSEEYYSIPKHELDRLIRNLENKVRQIGHDPHSFAFFTAVSTLNVLNEMRAWARVKRCVSENA